MSEGQPRPNADPGPPARDRGGATAPFSTPAEWAAHLRWRSLTTPPPSPLDHLREVVGAPIDRLEELVFGGEGTTLADRLVGNGIRVLNDLVQRPRRAEAVIERYVDTYPKVRSLADIRALPLDTIAAARPAWLGTYDLTAALSGGLGGFFGAPGMVISVPALFYASLHAIGSHAMHAGHDLSDPAEQQFAVSLFAASLVTRPSTRATVFKSLEVAAWALEADAPDAADASRIAILEHVAEAVALRVLLGLAVRGWPGVGLLLGAGFSRVFVGQICETALGAYEQRWLFRRHGDPARVVTEA